jgi:hypothetical protein
VPLSHALPIGGRQLLGNAPHGAQNLFFGWNLYIFRELGANAKFHNPKTTRSGRIVTAGRKKEEYLSKCPKIGGSIIKIC